MLVQPPGEVEVFEDIFEKVGVRLFGWHNIKFHVILRERSSRPKNLLPDVQDSSLRSHRPKRRPSEHDMPLEAQMKGGIQPQITRMVTDNK